MFNINDVVIVTVDRPAGVQRDYVKGTLGIIGAIDEENNYEVVGWGDTPGFGYWYVDSELRLATPEEKESALRQLLSHKVINRFV